MKLYNVKRAVLGLTIVGSIFISSCEKWLDVKPSNQTEASVIFSTERGFQEVLAGVYTKMSDASLYGCQLTYGLVDVIGQRWAINYNNDPYNDLSKYNYEIAEAIDTIDDIWGNQFFIISQLNNVLDHIDENKDVFASEANYSMIKGETLALRAFLHFDLFRLFAPYENTETKWLPYVDQYTRNTSESLTNDKFIEKLSNDLTDALELLKKDDIYTGNVNSDTYYINRHFHINYYAAKALQARVALYRNEKTIAAEAALEVVNAQKSKGLFRFVTIDEANNSVVAHRDRTFSSEHLFALNIRNLKDHIEDYFTEVSSLSVFKSLKAPGELYEGISEYRRQFFETESTVTDVPSKFWQLDRVPGTSLEQKKERMPLIRISEMYYILAECSNIQEATDYLNTVRNNRGIPTELSNLDLPLLDAEILKEYDKEFLGEGQMFYYHKRKNSVKINGSRYEAKYVLPLPKDEIEFGGRNDYYNEK